jgi:altronate dehydratase small subunit
MEKSKAIIMKPIDNVATAVEDIKAGTLINVNVGDSKVSVVVTETIPFGHKFAVRTIAKDERIIKYGESIGTATREIQVGQHTHVHNLVGCRGRGDLEGC